MSVLQAQQELIDQLEIELHGYSSRMNLLALNKAQGTQRLTRFIHDWAHSRNLLCEKEVCLGATRTLVKSGYIYWGYLDFVIDEWLAIEIDSSNKRWSLEKLEHAAHVGFVPVWIRWYSAQRFCVPPTVRLIMLPNRPHKRNLVRVV
jgi:hypothetical protein